MKKTITADYFKKWNPDVDYRQNPHLYRIGRGQQGVLICEPYKSGDMRSLAFQDSTGGARQQSKDSKNVLQFPRARRFCWRRHG